MVLMLHNLDPFTGNYSQQVTVEQEYLYSSTKNKATLVRKLFHLHNDTEELVLVRALLLNLGDCIFGL